AGARVFGFRKEAVLGRSPFGTFVPPPSRPHVEALLGRFSAGERDAHGTSEHVTRDGRRIVCEWHNTPLADADGRFIGFLSMAVDVTDRSRAEAERERLIHK